MALSVGATYNLASRLMNLRKRMATRLWRLHCSAAAARSILHRKRMLEL